MTDRLDIDSFDKSFRKSLAGKPVISGTVMSKDKIKPAMAAENWGDLRRFPFPDEPDEWRNVRPHELAALCLYGQPFGFTREDVEAIRCAASLVSNAEVWRFPDDERAARLNDIADRIEALLPPEE